MSYLIADLDFTLIKPKSSSSQRPSINNWKINISLDYLKEFNEIFIVTNQADARINLKYIEDVKKYLSKYLTQPISIIINKKRDIYRKPHVMSFIKYIKPVIIEKHTNSFNITWIGDQEDDYKFYCNCMLHIEKKYTGKFLYFNINDLNVPINPIFIKDTFENDNVQFNKNSNILIHMYLSEMKSTFLSFYRTFQVIKDFKNYSILYDSSLNIKIYLGKFNDDIKNIDDTYLLNTCEDTERIARYFQYTSYTTYVKHLIVKYYEKHKNIKVLKLYPNINTRENKLYFLELF